MDILERNVFGIYEVGIVPPSVVKFLEHFFRLKIIFHLRLYIWEILYLTINKMSKHVNRLTKELTEMRDKVGHTNGSSDSEEEEPQIKSEEKITEEMVERMEEKLESAQGDQKNLFLIIFQRFIMILSEHLVRCDTDGISHENYWYKWTIGRLQQVFLAVSIPHNLNTHSL